MDIRRTLTNNRIVVCLFLDISGAFDTAWHVSLKERLRRCRCPINWYYVMMSYLKEREIRYERDGVAIEQKTNRGCPQGSSSGPSIWNLVYNDMLELAKDYPWARIQAYADDGMIRVCGDTEEEIDIRCATILNRVIQWGKSNKLHFNREKTEILRVNRKGRKRKNEERLNEDIELDVEGVIIRSSKCVRYLGIHMDDKLNYRQHVDIALDKANKAMWRLSAMARKGSGISPGVVRLIYKVAVETVFSYGCAVWQKKARANQKVWDKIRQWHRKTTQKTARVMGTTAWEDAVFVANLLPIDLRLTELSSAWRLAQTAKSKVINNRRETVIDRQGYTKRTRRIDPNVLTKVTHEHMEGRTIENGTWWYITAHERGDEVVQISQHFNRGACNKRYTRLYNKKADDDKEIEISEKWPTPYMS